MLLSGHYFGSKRRAGFHFLAEAYHRLGWDVTFVTVSLSWLSVLRRDYRLQYPVRAEAGAAKELAPGLRSYVHFTTLHPANLRHPLLNRASSPVFRTYGRRLPRELAGYIRAADLVVFESTPGLLLVPAARALNPAARFVYRVSDDLRLLANHPVVIEAEAANLATFDLVSVPNAHMAGLFEGAPIATQPHGLDFDSLEGAGPSPYRPGRLAAVFVGNARFDHDFLQRAARLRPDIDFHVIGPIAGLPEAANVHAHGELPFRETLPWLRHAGLGLHTLAYSPGAECFATSLKVLQYTYFGLPVVAADFLRSSFTNIRYYRPGDDASIAAAIDAALAIDRTQVDRSTIRSWDDLAQELAA